MDRESEMQLEAYVEQSRQLTGTEVRERQPWNTEVTLDAIRHYVYGTDDDNPLWSDPEYAKTAMGGKNLAPPCFVVSALYPIIHGAKLKAPLSSLIGGVAYEWFKPIMCGDVLRAVSKQKDFYQKTNKAGRQLNFVISEVTYYNQHDDVVAIASGTMIMALQNENELMFERPIHRCSETELVELERKFKSEQRTGADAIYVDDIREGLEIPSITRGPLSIGDMVAWNAGSGPSYKAGRWGFLELSPHNSVRNPVTGFWVKNSQQHEDSNIAAGRGMPGPFDNGVMRSAWVAPLVTNWMGDGGFLRKLNVQVVRPAIYGDVTTYSALVNDVDCDAGTVGLEIKGTNQEGEVNTKGTAEVVLPKRG